MNVAVNEDGLAADLAATSLALARRLAAGATMWCCAEEADHARHVAVEFVHPVVVGKRALPAVALTGDATSVAALRAVARSGDVLVAIGPAAHPVLGDLVRRAPAWGVAVIWIGSGPRPPAGAADHVLWIDAVDRVEVNESFVRLYHLLWELTHVCFEHPGLLRPVPDGADVCVTCADEGRLAEIVAVDGDRATVRTPQGAERVDASLVDRPRPGDLVLVHAGTVITSLDGS